MTWKDELLLYWVLCSVVIIFVARHVWEGATYLVDHVAAFGIACMPAAVHAVLGHLR